MNEPALRVAGLCKSFGQLAVLANLDLCVAAGEVVALRGPNGAGKSTLLSCVVGNLIPDQGQVVVAGQDLSGSPLAARRALRHVPQEADVPEGVTGRELMKIWADVFQTTKVSDAEALADLGDALDLLASTYSVGMRRRLQLSVVALGRARLLVLDEPFAGLDGESSARVAGYLQEMAQAGCGILIAAHDAELRALADAPVRREELSALNRR